MVPGGPIFLLGNKIYIIAFTCMDNDVSLFPLCAVSGLDFRLSSL